MPRTSSAYDFEVLLPTDGTWLGLMLAPPKNVLGQSTPYADGAPRTVAEEFAAAVGGDALSTDLTARVQEDWSDGVGVSYNAAYSLYTRTAGYVLPAGAGTNQPIPATGHPSDSPLVAFAEYKGDLFIAQAGVAGVMGGRILRLPGGNGTLVEEYYVGSATELFRDLLVADDGSGGTVLFVTSEDTNHQNGRLHRFDGTSWAWTTAGVQFAASRGLGRMASVYWRTSDGNGGWRIVAITGAKTVAYTFPNVNPQTGTSVWSPDLRIGTTGSLLEIAAMRRHVYFGATDDLYDIDEMGDSQAMTSYLRRMLQTGNGYAIETLNNYIYLAVGRGLIRVYVGDGHYDEVPLEGQCAPGWGTPAENEARGYVTALCVDQGYLVCAVYNPTTQKSYLYWGIDRRNSPRPVQTQNPLIWYGPEVVVGRTADGAHGTPTEGYRVNRIVSSGLSGVDLRLWVASQTVNPGTGVVGGPSRLDWVSLPIAGSPIQDLVSQGAQRFAPGHLPTYVPVTGDVLQMYCSLEGLADSGGDKGNISFVYQHTVGSRGLDALQGTILKLYERADPDPKSTAWTFQGDVTRGPIVDLLPVAPVVSGHKLQYRVDFFSPRGTAPSTFSLEVAILDSLRTLVWERAPSLAVRTLTVQYGDGVQDINGTRDTLRNPDDISAALKALVDGKQTVIRDRNDQRWSVNFRQVSDGTSTYVDGGIWGKRVVRSLQVQVLGPA